MLFFFFFVLHSLVCSIQRNKELCQIITPTCLTGQAKSYALGPDASHIFQALRSRFGLTARAARDHLRAIRKDKKTSLTDHANAIEALAQVAHGNDDPEAQRGAVYEAFFHTVNNPRLQWYYLAAKVTTIKKALALGKAYYQIK